MGRFGSSEEAVLDLLRESFAIADGAGCRPIVVGGWLPYLYRTDELPHAGTRDVDLLFPGGSVSFALQNVFKAFLESEYLPSLKHKFQLIRVHSIGGRDVALSVDMLHPGSVGELRSLFVDQIELDFPEDLLRQVMSKGMSIMLPDAGFLFKGETQDLAVNDEGAIAPESSELITFPSDMGLIATKAKVRLDEKSKRFRDPYDIVIVLSRYDDDELNAAIAGFSERRPSSAAALLPYAKDETIQAAMFLMKQYWTTELKLELSGLAAIEEQSTRIIRRFQSCIRRHENAIRSRFEFSVQQGSRAG